MKDRIVEQMKRKPTDRLMAALELRQGQAVREVGPGRFIVKSQSKPGLTYSVGFNHNGLYCACADFVRRQRPCKHTLAAFSPALDFMLQLRWATEYEDVAVIISFYAGQMAALPEQIKAAAREEVRAARERLTGMTLAKAA